jgi:probable phosphoglycerate mutase
MNQSLFPTPAADSGELFTAHCDGGSRGNPGPSGYGAVIEDAQGHVAAEMSEYLGLQTNNFAEYSGLLGVLKWAVEHNVKRLSVVSDSELMVKQMQGRYAVKSPILRPLFEEARKLSRKIDRFEMRHTLRGGNKTADRLANEAMDRGMGKKQGTGISEQGSASGVSSVAARPYGKLVPSAAQPSNGCPRSLAFGDLGDHKPHPAKLVPSVAPPSSPPPAPKPTRQILEGYVKDGVVHLLGGELPDGIFVKIVRE